jgi:RNA polymerase sigma-70 factor (ECF subfamily)
MPEARLMSSPFPAARYPAFPLRKKKESETPRPSEESTVELRGEPSDESLLAQLCVGSREALAVLFERYARVTRSVALRILRDRAEAEDLVQDLFLFIQRKCSIFDSSKSSARSWIIQMTYHRAIERRRYLTARRFYAREDAQDVPKDVVGIPTNENDYSAEAVFGRNGMEKVFRSLSEDQRETLRLHFFEGLTLVEVASNLGQPHGNVKHHFYRGLAKLRKQMFKATVRVAEPQEKSGRESGSGK